MLCESSEYVGKLHALSGTQTQKLSIRTTLGQAQRMMSDLSARQPKPKPAMTSPDPLRSLFTKTRQHAAACLVPAAADTACLHLRGSDLHDIGANSKDWAAHRNGMTDSVPGKAHVALARSSAISPLKHKYV